MSRLSIFLRKKLFKFQPSPSQSPSEKDTIIIAGKPFSPNWPPPPTISPAISPAISPTASPPYSYNTPTKKSPLLKKPKRAEEDLIPSQNSREYKRIIDNE